MQFSVLDRLVLNALVPKMIPPVASRALYSQIDDIGRALSFSDEEMAEIDLVIGDNGDVKWAAEKAKDKDIEIGPALLKVIADGFRRMDTAGDLPRDALSVFDKFVPADEWAKEK